MTAAALLRPVQLLLPWVLGIIVATYFARRLGLRDGAYLAIAEPKAASRLRLILGTALVGVFARSILQAIQVVNVSIRMLQAGLPYFVGDAEVDTADTIRAVYVFILEPIVWLLVFLLAAGLLLRFGRVRIAETTGFRLSAIDCWLMALPLAWISMWPLELVRLAAGLLEPFIVEGLTPDVLAALARSKMEVSLQVVRLAAYVLGAWLAREQLRAMRTEGSRGWPRSAFVGAYLVVVFALADGVEPLVGTIAGALVAGAKALSAVREGTADFELRLQFLLVVVPLLAYPVAVDALGSVRWPDVARRLSIPRPDFTRLLIIVGLAAQLSWFFSLPDLVRVLLRPIGSIDAPLATAVTAVAVVVAWAVYMLHYRKVGNRSRVRRRA